MQFVVIAHDGDDPQAQERRKRARSAHIDGAMRMKANGSMLTGGAILDDDGVMIGSVIIVDFPSRAELDTWLTSDPYTTGDVWRRVEVRPFRVAV